MNKLASNRCKQNARWRYLSQTKAISYQHSKIISVKLQTQQAIIGDQLLKPSTADGALSISLLFSEPRRHPGCSWAQQIRDQDHRSRRRESNRVTRSRGGVAQAHRALRQREQCQRSGLHLGWEHQLVKFRPIKFRNRQAKLSRS